MYISIKVQSYIKFPKNEHFHHFFVETKYIVSLPYDYVNVILTATRLNYSAEMLHGTSLPFKIKDGP